MAIKRLWLAFLRALRCTIIGILIIIFILGLAYFCSMHLWIIPIILFICLIGFNYLMIGMGILDE